MKTNIFTPKEVPEKEEPEVFHLWNITYRTDRMYYMLYFNEIIDGATNNEYTCCYQIV